MYLLQELYYEEQISYDKNRGLKTSDAILMAGGLRRDAYSFAHLNRVDPLNPGDYEIIRLHLENLMGDDSNADNLVLEPFDSIYVYSRNEFYDEIQISISEQLIIQGSLPMVSE